MDINMCRYGWSLPISCKQQSNMTIWLAFLDNVKPQVHCLMFPAFILKHCLTVFSWMVIRCPFL